MAEKQNAVSDGGQPEKRVWEAPAIQQLDFGATEAAYIPGSPSDLGIYTV